MMKNLKKDEKLYNVLFPLWMLMLFPQVWLIVLPGNFIIDSAVLLLTLLILKVGEKKKRYKQHILKIYGFGLLADAVGAGLLLLTVWLLGVSNSDLAADSPIITIPAMIISAALIFVFNYFITFKKEEKKLRLTLSLVFAIVTAPYTFLVPTTWLY